eukprot:scaffold25179_cov145-Amphora_coffeaeformis.AAC.1
MPSSTKVLRIEHVSVVEVAGCRKMQPGEQGQVKTENPRSGRSACKVVVGRTWGWDIEYGA